MGHKKADATKLGAVVSENATEATSVSTVGVSEKRKKLGQAQEDAQPESNIDARYGMKTRHAAEIASRNRKMRLEAELDTERSSVSDDAATRIGELMTAGVESLRDEVLFVAGDKRRGDDCTQKNSLDDTKKSDRGTSIKARHRKLETQLNEPLLRAEGSWLETSEAGLIDRPVGKPQGLINVAKDDKQPVSSKGERDLTSAQQKARIQCDDKCQLQKTITALERQKRKIEHDLVVMEKEAEDRSKLHQALTKELGQAQGDFERMRTMSLQDIMQAVKKNSGLQNDLVSMREEKNRLRSSLDAVLKNLEEEKEKRLCQICLESQKDTICFPCLHLNYCFPCLEKHRKQNNSCPSCRAAVTGVLRCDICM